MKEVWMNALTDAQVALESLIANEKLLAQCTALGDAIAKCFKSGHKVLICGNGGSHCDALHFAEEWTGRYRKDRRALPVMALGEATHTTCVANDFGFADVFARQVEAFGNKGDIFIGITTSGNSENVLRAIAAAETKGMSVWTFLGKDGGQALSLSPQHILVPGKTTDRIQELHMLILHICIEHGERILFPENY